MMDFVYYLLPLAILMGLVGLMAFMWTLKSGQYDDLDGAAWRAIMDDDKELIPSERKKDKTGKNSSKKPQNPVDKSID